MQAGEFKAGEQVVTLSGATSAVAWVHVGPGLAEMYNLTVANDHTFAVGSGQYVVHNTCGEGGYFASRAEALQAAEEHAGIALDGESGDGVIRMDRQALNEGAKMPSRYPGEYYLNPTDRWDPYGNVRAWSEAPGSKAQIFEHPFGHNDLQNPARPVWHDYGHIHSTNTAGEENVYWYGPPLDVTQNG